MCAECVLCLVYVLLYVSVCVILPWFAPRRPSQTMLLAAILSVSAVSLSPAVHGRAVSLVASNAPWLRCGAARCEVAKSASAKRRERRRTWYKENKGAEELRQSGARVPPPAPPPPPPPTALYSLDALLRIAEDGRQHPSASDLKAGDRVMVTAVSSSGLGLSVETVACRRPGLVFADEAAYPPGGSFGSDPVEVGDTVPAYVLKVRPDSRLDICFRPVDPARRLHEAAAAVLAALVDAAERGEPLPLGDDSEPRAVRRLFPGLSKSGFKARPLLTTPLLTTHNSLLTSHLSPLTAHNSRRTTHHSPRTTRYSPLATHHSLLTTHYSPLITHTTHCSPLITHHSF